VQQARRAAVKRRELAAAVPETLEIVTLAISAGMMIEETFQLVVDCGPTAVVEAFGGALARLRAGSTRREVLTGIAISAGAGFAPMAQVLLAAERDGAPIALLLDRLAEEASVAHRHAAQERAGRVPVLLLAPLVVCSLPAVLIGTVVPFVIVTLGQTSF
jgi:pilus assembly protein TadC